MSKLEFVTVICFLLLTGCAAPKASETIDSRQAAELFFLEPEEATQKETAVPGEVIVTRANVLDFQDDELLQKHLYTYDKALAGTKLDLDLEQMLSLEVSADLQAKDPVILIFHTHSQEAYADSTEGDAADSIVGMGRELAEILVNEHGISVVHDEGVYDIAPTGKARKNSYEYMAEGVAGLLEKYPGIQVAIDMHRDGVPENLRFVTEIDGEQAAKIMFFNGVGKKAEQENPYIAQNMALSLQMQLTANELYPGLARKIYLKPDTYSLNLLPNSMLVEVGANTNTVAEARNALRPLAEILVTTLGRK